MATGSWHRIDIAGKPADVYDPPTAPRFGILDLHPVGLETLAHNPTFSRLFDELGLACICPHGARSWWTDRICPEFDDRLSAERHLLNNVLPVFGTRWHLRPPAIAVTGISMGGQGALRLAFRHAKVFPVAAAISAAIDFHERHGQGSPLDDMYDSKEQARQDTVILHVNPSAFPPHVFFCIDPDDVEWFRGNDRLHEKLTALGLPHTCDLTTRGGGHTWTYFNAQADRVLRFAVAGLEQVSRRLL